MGKIALYFLTTILVIISLDSVNINKIFKKASSGIFSPNIFAILSPNTPTTKETIINTTIITV